MTNAIERLDASVARVAKDVSEIVERIRGNVGLDAGAVLADCDRLDALSDTLEGLSGTQSGGEAAGTDRGAETPVIDGGTPEQQAPSA